MRQNRHRPMPLALIVATTMGATATHAQGSDWTFSPSVRILETYTDNVALASKGNERSDRITQLSPGLDLTHQSRRLKVKGDYTMNYLNYANSQVATSTFHELNALANAELLQDLFFFDARAGISQHNASPFGPQSTNNLNLTNNRTEVRTYSISPYIRKEFGPAASAELRYSHDYVTSSTAGLLQNNTDRIQLDVNSGSAFRTFGWGFNYSNQTLHYRNADDVDLGSTSGTLRYLPSQDIAFSMTAGYEKNTYVSVAEKPTGAFWLAGVLWTPSPRTSIDAKIGHRFYGRTYALASSHRARYSVWSLGYQEEISTTPSLFAVPVTISTANFLDTLWKNSIPDPTARQQVIESFIQNTGLPTSMAQSVNILTNRVFLQKSLNGSVALNTAKTTLLVSLYRTSREGQSPIQSDITFVGPAQALLEDSTRQNGINAVFNWRLTQQTALNLGAGDSRARSLSTGRTDRNKTASVSLTTVFQPKVKGTIEVRRRNQTSTSNQSNGNIRENAVAASLLVSF